MLLKLGNCLIDPQKVICVEKRKNEWANELFVSFDKDSYVCVIKADSPEQQEEFFNTIWEAASINYVTVNWKLEGENKNG